MPSVAGADVTNRDATYKRPFSIASRARLSFRLCVRRRAAERGSPSACAGSHPRAGMQRAARRYMVGELAAMNIKVKIDVTR